MKYRSAASVSVVSLLGIAIRLAFIVDPASTQSASNCPYMDLALVIPTSTDSTSWSSLKTFIHSFLNDMDIGGPTANAQVAVIKYTNSSQTEFALNTYQSKSAILSAVDAMQPLSGTGRNVADAETKLPGIFPFGTSVTRSGAKQLAVIFFDSASDSKTNAIQQAQVLTNYGIYVLCVGLTSQVDTNEMQQVATSPSDNTVSVYSISSYGQLASKVAEFETFLCTTRKPICPKQADVGIIIDDSTSIASAPGGYTNFDKIKNFTKSIVQAFPIGQDLTRVGVVLFSSASQIVFNLLQYTTSADIQGAIDKIIILGGETNISGALNDGRRLLTTPSLGARLNVKKILFIITDGKANLATRTTQTEANATKAAGIEIFAVGMTNQIDVNELTNIASSPASTHFYYAADFGNLTDVLIKILGDTCLVIQTTTPTTITPPSSRTTTTPTTTTTTPTTTTPTTTTPTTPTTTPTTTTPTTTTTTPTTTTTTPTTTTTTPTTTTPTTTTTTPTTTITTPTTTTTTPTTTTTTPTTTTTTPTTTTTTPTTTTPTTTTTTPTTTTPTTTYRIPDPLPTCNNSVDVVFMVDATSNIDYTNFQKVLNFIRDLCLLLSIDSGLVRVGLVTYSDQPLVDFYLKDYTKTSVIRTAILNATYIGNWNNIAGCLEFLRTSMFTDANGARLNIPHVGILFTSGRSRDPAATQQQADMARRAGISLLVVALGNWLDMDEVNAIASYPTQNNVYQKSYDSLQQNSAQPVVDQICQNINVCKTSNPCLNGGACKNQISSQECVCQPGYGGSDCNQVCRRPADVIFAVDSSGSIGLDNWRLITSFLMNAVQMLDLDTALQSVDSNSGTRVGLLTFSNSSNIVFNLNSFMDKNALLQAFNTRYLGGGTNTASAIRTAVDQMFTPANGDRQNVTNYLVVVTDGMSDNTTATWMEAMRARSLGVVIVAIGIGNQFNYNELRSIASYPDATNVLTTNFTTLGTTLAGALGTLLCNNVDDCQPNPCKNGQCFDGSGSFMCGVCPPNTTGSLCERNCTGFIDLIFILDASGSIQFERFPKLKEFVVGLLANLSIGPNDTRVGLLYFSDTDHIAFYLNSYTLKQDVIQAVRNVPFIAGKTNTASALHDLYTTMYLDKNGGRIAARRMAIFITDGEANVDAQNTVMEAVKAHQSMIQIITVAVGQPAFVNGDQIEAIASIPTSANMFNISSYNALSNISTMLLMSTCNDVNECTSNPCQNGATCVNDYGRYYCLCSTTYSGYNCERQCTRQMDVVFVLDLSGSVEQSGDYRPMIDFVRRIIYGLDVRSGMVRVGVVTFTGQVDDQIFLKDYDRSPENLIYAISFNHNGGKTNTQAALADVQSAQFTQAAGDRPGAPDIVIFMSDGNSDVPEGSAPGANAAQNLRSSGATIYTVGIGDAPNSAELGNIAGNALESSFDVSDWSETTVTNAVRSILDKLCQP